MGIPEVLIVDNDDGYLESLSIALDSYFIVRTASRGLEAVNIMNSIKNLSLVVLDLHMPEMTGVELLETIKSANNKIPILVVTGKNCDICIKKCVDLGIQTYTDKLVNVEELIYQMTKLIGENGLDHVMDRKQDFDPTSIPAYCGQQ